MRTILDWLGEEVGPRPGEACHAVLLDGAKLMVSREFFDELAKSAGPLGEIYSDDVNRMLATHGLFPQEHVVYGAWRNSDPFSPGYTQRWLEREQLLFEHGYFAAERYGQAVHPDGFEIIANPT
jgi:hypothetical protein